MKNLTPKRTLLYGLFLLMVASYSGLYAAKSAYQPAIQLQKGDGTAGLPSAKRKLLVDGYCRKYDVPKEVGLFIVYFVYGNPLQYKNKPLPNDLTEQDLGGYDFTGCHFTHTNLTDSNLANVILTNTTCDYQKAFLDNIKKNKCSGGNWYQNNLPKDLKSIAEVYLKLNSHTHKAKLLQVACGFARLPFYGTTAFYIKVAYWSSELLQLKQKLGNHYGEQLICSLTRYLSEDASNCCWKTKYPQDKIAIATRDSHANFAQYLREFNNGLTRYQCKSNNIYGFNWYKEQIAKNIEGLAATYPHIKEKQLQQAACAIAHALSKSYQIQKVPFLHHYLFFQNRLIWIKKSVSLGMKNEVYYSMAKGVIFMKKCWNRVEK